ncbi:MAG TPA: STAS domain-containing protein [Pilimelia sp.]|nr:STAS domain-containing protein [Pilimelia sp.]
MSFAISVRRQDAFTALLLTGELDMATAPHLGEHVDDLLSGGHPRIVVDLHDLTFCDSSGLNAFVQGDRRCTAEGGWLRVTRPRGHVARVLELSGVAEVLAYSGDEA